MGISTRTRQDVTIVDLSGRLSAADGGAALRQVVKTILNEGKRYILLNLQGLEWMDSSGLGELVRVRSMVANNGGTLKLVYVQGRVKDVMALANATGSFKIYNDEGAAVSSYR